jgi:hypothetical protein
MKNRWGAFWQSSRNRLKAGWLVTAGLIAIYVGAVEPMNQMKSIATERSVGLAAVAEWQPRSMWRQRRPMRATLDKSVVGGIPGGGGNIGRIRTATPTASSDGEDTDRKTIRTGSMDLVVKTPRDTSEKIRQLPERVGGYLVNSETYGAQESSSASLQIRVPATKFEEVRAEIRKLGLRVEGEKINAEDVTKQYVDQSARLHNLRAQETQYLGILKQAKTVKDTLEVSDKLNEVRGEIDQQQAEFDALSKQVETVALPLTLRAEAEAQVFGLHWRPLYQLKLAARQGIDGVGDYAAAMASFLFYLPSVLLWLATILLGATVGWRILRWAGKALFVPRTKAA